jgi:hypothetical protein
MPTNRDVWFQIGSRIHQKYEVLYIANKLDISVNETVGALIRLWAISITDFPEGQGKLQSGDLTVNKHQLPHIMKLEDKTGDQIFEALETCSWIKQDENFVLEIPKWESKIGQTMLKLEKDRIRKLKKKDA